MNIKSKTLLCLIAFSPFAFANNIGESLFNSMQFEKAKTVLPALSESGDADASFWLALVQFRTGKSYDAGDTMLTSAEQGNPWAMRLLVPEWNGYCGYLGWPCDEKWRKKAISGWEKLADKNDGKAIYALLKWGEQWWKSIPVYRDYKYSEMVDKAVKNGGYQSVSFNSSFPITLEKKIKLLKYSVNKNDVKSMFSLYAYCKKGVYNLKNCTELLKRALVLGDVSASVSLYNKYRGFDTRYPKLKLINPKKAYYYYVLAKYFKLEKNKFSLENMSLSSEDNAKLIKEFDMLDKNKIMGKAQVISKKIKPNLFYDESFPYDVLLKP